MRLKIICNGDGSISLKRSIAFTGFLVMSIAFVNISIFSKVTADMFITYPLGLLILYFPQLAVTLLKIYKGAGN